MTLHVQQLERELRGVAMKQRPTVLVVDDDAETRRQLRTIVKSASLDVKTFSDMEAFLEDVRPDQPGCLVLNAQMPGVSGPELQQELAVRKVPMPVIMLTEYADVFAAVTAMKAGAFDVIEKPYLRSHIVGTIRKAIAQDLKSRRASEASEDTRHRYRQLTRRERQVLRMVVTGLKSQVIAARLGIREKTVEVYRSRINKKMRTHNAAELVRLMHGIDLRPAQRPVEE